MYLLYGDLDTILLLSDRNEDTKRKRRKQRKRYVFESRLHAHIYRYNQQSLLWLQLCAL